jgi:hypothetical protein
VGIYFQVSVVENSKPDKPTGLMQRSLEGTYFKGFAGEPSIFAKNGLPEQGADGRLEPRLSQRVWQARLLYPG